MSESEDWEIVRENGVARVRVWPESRLWEGAPERWRARAEGSSETYGGRSPRGAVCQVMIGAWMLDVVEIRARAQGGAP